MIKVIIKGEVREGDFRRIKNAIERYGCELFISVDRVAIRAISIDRVGIRAWGIKEAPSK